MIMTYNPKIANDALLIFMGPNPDQQKVESRGNITRISDAETGFTTGINIFHISDLIDLGDQRGMVALTPDQLAKVNQAIMAAGFQDEVTNSESGLVVGEVLEMTDHPDSDHLHVTQTAVGDGRVLQIVSGSPNMRAGIKVVVATPGAMMPSGNLIWDGQLRGVPSAGMIVSGRELQLPEAPNRPGALVLPDDFGSVGEPFDFKKAQNLYRDGQIDLNY
ncbi:DUF4479 and tRNA-binding domain-containing protein [Leuconostocaceae bacterium ESL0723]|nr:DUF4479 and tRNA-binding domain-containing protein [Leuconostocaceae bacterium ESL0723]